MSSSLSESEALFLDPLILMPAVERLGGGVIRQDAQGHPVRAAGRHAVVYELRTPTGRIFALRLHLRPDRDRDQALAERYAALQSDHRLDVLRAPDGPLPRDIQWLPEGLRIPGAKGSSSVRPLVTMERVPGRTLREMVARLCHEEDAAHLAMLADGWLGAATAMETVGFVHGDLSPDNLMVRPDGSITVVDLDTASWPSFSGENDVQDTRSALNHPRGAPHNPGHHDRFPALLLWSALRILATHPELLAESQEHAEGLLFSNADLRRPSGSAMFARLDEAEPSLRLLLEVVRRAVRFSPDELPALSEIAHRLEGLGFPRLAPRIPNSAPQPTSSTAVVSATTPVAVPTPPVPSEPGTLRQTTTPSPFALDRAPLLQRLDALQAALVQRDGQEARRLWTEVQANPLAQPYAAAVHQLTEHEGHSAIDRALRRRDDAALLQAIEVADSAGVAVPAHASTAAREARRRANARASLSTAIDADDRSALSALQRTGQLDDLGPHDPVTARAIARALAWPSLERALASDDDAAICASADPGLWREEETRPHSVWLRLDLAWARTRWSHDLRAALRRRDGPYLRGLLAKAPSGAEQRLTEVERRRVQRVIARGQATTRLERALREGPDREVVEALADLESSGAPFSDVLDWSAVRGVVDRLSLADSLRDAMAAEPPDAARMARLLPAARAALGDLQRAGAEWAELEQAVLRAAHLERLREAIASGGESNIAAAADPDPFLVRELLTPEEAALVAAVLTRTRTQMRRQVS